MSDAPPPAGLRAAISRRPLAAALWITLFLSVPVVVFLRHRPRPLPVLATLPAWQLTDAAGRRFGSEQLRGRAYVANFMFTSCATVCPLLARHLARVQANTAALGDRLHLVSISVDPVVDTPARLTEYGHRYGADPRRWHFVTGDAPALQRIAADGFRVALGVTPTTGDGRPQHFDILHSANLMLVDGDGRMRGVYRADDEGLAELTREASALVGH
ncbi:MAG: photosynthetic protein synthase [Myxococcaceae bacterium]|nr:photosynthetic protein synthase [Myxococcaceae bacterium]